MNKLFQKVENFESPQKFWCHDCDMKAVESDDPETGTFFRMFGHELSYFYDSCTPKEEYISVCFALCPACLKAREGSPDL